MKRFAILTMQKTKSGDVSGLENHCNRKFENHINTEIDISKSHLNVSLIKHDNLKEKIKKEINKHYTSKRKYRSDAVMLNSFIIGASDEYFKTLSREKQLEYFTIAKEFMEKKYKHVVMADIHFDETSPHMHLGIVPLVYDEKRKVTTLSSKLLFDKLELKILQKEFPIHMQQHGFDVVRGIKNSKKKYVKSIEEFKKQETIKIKEYIDKAETKELQEIRKIITSKEEKGFVNKTIKLSVDEKNKILKYIPYVDDFYKAKLFVERVNSDNENNKNKENQVYNQILELEKENNMLNGELNKLRNVVCMSKELVGSFQEKDISEDDLLYLSNRFKEIGIEEVDEDINNIKKQIVKAALDQENPKDIKSISVNWNSIKKYLRSDVKEKIKSLDFNEELSKRFELICYTSRRKEFVKKAKNIFDYNNGLYKLNENTINEIQSKNRSRGYSR